MEKTYSTIAAFSMAMAVILGALGAHALVDLLTPTRLESFKTGVTYQIYHSLAIFIVMIFPNISRKVKSLVGLLFVLGIVFFSFSIYLLSLRHILGIEGMASYLGPITPMGGIIFITGWVILGFSILRFKNIEKQSQ